MELTGKCLCGAVRFKGEGGDDFGVCQCSMCRVWNGGPVLAATIQNLQIEGEQAMTAYPSSEWGERCFCSKCGTHLFWRMADKSMTVAMAGVLDQIGELKMASEIYIDEKPAAYAFAGDHARLTGAEFLASIGMTPPE